MKTTNPSGKKSTPGLMSMGPKATKESVKAKVPANHPAFLEMAVKAIKALKDRKGSSRQAVLKYILANFDVGDDAKKINSHLKTALKRGVTDGSLKQMKGTGATGSFRIGDKKPTEGTVVKKPPKAPAEATGSPKPKAAGEKVAKKPARMSEAPKKAAPAKKAARMMAGSPRKVAPTKKPKAAATTAATAAATVSNPTPAAAAKPKATKKPAAAKKPASPKKTKADKPKPASPKKVESPKTTKAAAKPKATKKPAAKGKKAAASA